MTRGLLTALLWPLMVLLSLLALIEVVRWKRQEDRGQYMATCTKTAIIWDLDGTLVDSREDLAAAGNIARAALGCGPLPVTTVASYVGDGVQKLLERLLPGATAAELAHAHTAFAAHYAVHCADRTRTYPGISEVLQALATAGCRQAVVTNKPEEYSRRILATLRIDRHFSAVIGGDRWKKPAPEGVLEALRLLDASKDQAVMVGDHHTDLLAASAAGVSAIWCAWGLGHAGEAHGYLTCALPTDLLATLLAGNGAAFG